MLTPEQAKRLRKGHKVLLDAVDHMQTQDRYARDIVAARALCTVSKAYSERLGFVRYELDTGNGHIIRGVADTRNVTRIMKKQWKDYEDNAQIVLAAVNARRERIWGAILGAHVPLNERNLDFTTRTELETNYNHISLGDWDVKGNQFTRDRNTYYSQVCCSLTRTNKDMEVFIPKVFLDYFGYSEQDLIDWLQFLSQCNFGFVYQYNGLKETIGAPPDYRESYDKRDSATKDRITTYQNCYSIYLKNPGSAVNMYGNFICLRYIYNDQYWNIPATAMRIKAELGDEVTHWRALLLAHLRMKYYYYYNLINPNNGGIPDIYKNPDEIFGYTHDLRHGSYMNNRFDRIREITYDDVMRFFPAEDYRGLWAFLQSKRTLG
jgi:hypothetical protein